MNNVENKRMEQWIVERKQESEDKTFNLEQNKIIEKEMNLDISKLKLGTYVKVKKGVKAPGFDYQLMDGWQGKVTEIHKETRIVEIE